MAKQVKALERFRQIRQNELERLGQQYQQKQQDCANHQRRLEQLGELYDSCQVVAGEPGLAWANRYTLRGHLQHLAGIQSQALALSQAEQTQLQRHVSQQHIKVKSLETVIDKRHQRVEKATARREQKLMDEIATQRFMHRSGLTG